MAYENMTVIDVRKRNSDGTYGTAFSISEGIVGDSMRLSQILFNSNYINLGEINSDMFEVELDISLIPEAYQNLKGYFIDVKRYNSDGASTYGHIFRGYIKDFKLDKTGQFATITALDMYWYKKNIETSLASWWGNFWRSKVLESVQLPISLRVNSSWTTSQVNDHVKQYVYNLIPSDCYATIGELFDSFLDYTNTDYSMKGDTKDEIEDCTNYNARVYLKHCSLGSASGFIGSGVWSYVGSSRADISISDIYYDWLQSQDSTLTYEYLLSQFCQALGLVPHFANREQQIWDEDSIKLNLFTFSTELTSKLLDDTNIDYSASSFESVYMPSFDKLIVTSSTTSGENQSELQPYEYGTGSMSYTIVDNPFLCAVSGTYNEQAIANLYDIISGFPVYLPSDITLVDSNWYDGPTSSNLNYIYDLGDKVETSKGMIVVMQTEFSGTGFINQSIRCLGDTDEITQVTSQVTSQASSSISTIGTIVNLFQYNAMKDNLISGATLKDATITGAKITDATITGGKIANSTITSTQIADSTITNAKIANSTITGSKIVDGTLDGSTKIANATISYAKMDSSFVGNLVADSAFITELQAEIATFGYITAAEADLDYAQIDFANVANGAINTALIHDGAITDAKIATMSANKLTAGTIDASNITVTNLNATNITTGSITVDGITIDVTNNEASIDGGYIEDGTITMNGLSSDVVAIIDGAIETFTCTDVPTLQNYPASTWTSSDYDKHIGDVAYVVNPSSSADGYTYRFTKSSNNQYSWVLIKDTDITKALQDILDLQGDVDAIESFDSTVSSFMTNTDSEITSLKGRTSSLETTMGTKVDTSTFNTLSQTVDTNSSNITTLTTTTNSLGTRMTQAESDITQNAQAITTKVSNTDFTGQNMMSLINQDASSVTISASKVNLNGYLNITNSFGNRNLFKLKDSVPGYFEVSSGSIVPQASTKERTTDYIPVTASGTYTVQAWYDTTNPTSSYEWICVNVYDSNKNYISQPIRYHISGANYKKYTLNIPSNGAYVRISSRWVEKGYEYAKVKLEKGTTASPWTIAPEDEIDSSDIYSTNTTTIDGGKITTGSIVANKINVSKLSTISANMGEITAGTLKSDNYVADTSGMKLTLSDGAWDSKDFKISSTGAITSTAGTIGGWTIGNNTLSSTVWPEEEAEVRLDATISSSNTSIELHRWVGASYSLYTKLDYSKLNVHYSALSLTHDARYTDKKVEIEYEYSLGDNKHYLCECGINFTSSSQNSADSAMLKLTDVNGGVTISAKTNDGIVITNNSSDVFSVSTAGAITTSSTITSTGLITAKNGVDSWGKLEGNTLKINNTGASSFNILGGGSIAGTLAVGGNITSNNKKVVVDDYSSGFMGFTTATVTKTVNSGTSTLTNLTYVDLTPGVYAVECTAEWDSNSTTGYRHLVLSTSSTGGPVDRFAAVTGPAGPSYDRQSFVRLFHLTSNTRFYLNAQQNSGSPISVLGGIQALRLGSN